MLAIKLCLCLSVITWTFIGTGLGIDCRGSTIAWDYTGTIQKTKSGRQCMNWTQASGKPGAMRLRGHFFPSYNIIAASSYCRNPSESEGGPWCYWADHSGSFMVVKWDYCDVPWCTESDKCPYLRQISPESTGGHITCELLQDDQDVSSLDACKDLTCRLGGNAFNFQGTECWVKSCKGSNYGWSDTDGYDVYAIDMCPADFTLEFPKSSGVATDCSLVACNDKISLGACKQYTCAKGGNAFNFKDDSCCVKRCENQDLKLVDTMGGYDVYTLDTLRDWCYTNFKLASPVSAGKITDCTYITGFHNVNLDFCMQYACNNYYNAFNYKDNNCYIKQCESSNDLKLVEAGGGYDVYAMEACDMTFKLAYPRSEGKSSDCPLFRCINGMTIQGCKNYACSQGYNVFNFRDNTCCIKQCEALDDLKLTKTYGGFDIFVKDVCQGSVLLKYPQSDGKAIGCPDHTTFDETPLEACQQLACIKGYHAFMFKESSCMLMKCASTDDLQLTGLMGGIDIYVVDEGTPARRSEP